ncbi:MAG: hypothetical protein HN778_05485 [Prolixibacteraceae bacterium]|jgi:hypothetical protein|nr:hypothetical protein [Prolixibacteraceae bacterium]MBT6762981.1 hypothetical protein [Prolixibacteraceae bacterium]MBT7394270.1 hypothetical protein [Prolixibacteraceae bacterium]
MEIFSSFFRKNRCNLSLILIVVIVLFIEKSVVAQDYLAVTDAGEAAGCNNAWPAEVLGTYEYSGTENSKKYWENSNGFFIYFASNYWYVGSVLGSTSYNNSTVRFYQGSSADLPPYNTNYLSTNSACGLIKIAEGTAPPPTAPTLYDPSASDVGSTNVQLYWSKVIGASGYYIYVSRNNNFSDMVSGYNRLTS